MKSCKVIVGCLIALGMLTVLLVLSWRESDLINSETWQPSGEIESKRHFREKAEQEGTGQYQINFPGKARITYLPKEETIVVDPGSNHVMILKTK